jgi:hypothetical protein
MSNKLLFHIAYYMSDKKRIDSKNKIDKSKSEYNNHVLNGVCSFLKEINDYEGFSYKKVVLDVNIENSFVSRIQTENYPDIDLEICVHSFLKEHPFRLTTKHRLSMKEKLNEYDWFGYSEDDTIIFNKTVQFFCNHLNSFYKRENKVYTIPRMVYDKNGEYYYSDIVKPSLLDGKKYTVPTNRFGACWLYSKEIMKDWINSLSFLNFNYPNRDGGIRVKMGLGFIEKNAVIPININSKEPEVDCVHLGYSGEYYFKHPRGFHCLKKNKLIQ